MRHIELFYHSSLLILLNNRAMNGYKKLLERSRQLHHLHSAIALMEWDLETYMPKGGSESRSEAIAFLARRLHENFTSDEMGQLIEDALADTDLTDIQRKNVQIMKEDYEKAKKLPPEFVEEFSKTTSKAFIVWQEAKHKSDFSMFKPYLAKIVDLNIEKANLLGWKSHPYDALLSEYDKSATTELVENVFSTLKEQFVDFVQELLDKENIDDSFLKKYYDKQKQWEFTVFVLKKLGYPFDKGRMDYSEHPFTIGINIGDVRITTKANEYLLGDMLLSSIHEMGHALYDLGLPTETPGTPMSESTSLSIHESQSRFWENYIARSLPFWEHFYTALQGFFHEQLSDISLWKFYRALNKVSRCPIRIQSDELTYHFHIMIRYELEKALIEKNLSVDDLPHEWNTRYKAYLGIDIKNDAEGVLQDVHWSHGTIGYFPTYSLGTFYGSQFLFAMERDIPELWQLVREGNFTPIHKWLHKNIWSHGRLLTSEEIAQQATGEGLNVHYFIQYAKNKYLPIYEGELETV